MLLISSQAEDLLKRDTLVRCQSLVQMPSDSESILFMLNMEHYVNTKSPFAETGICGTEIEHVRQVFNIWDKPPSSFTRIPDKILAKWGKCNIYIAFLFLFQNQYWRRFIPFLRPLTPLFPTSGVVAYVCVEAWVRSLTPHLLPLFEKVTSETFQRIGVRLLVINTTGSYSKWARLSHQSLQCWNDFLKV